MTIYSFAISPKLSKKSILQGAIYQQNPWYACSALAHPWWRVYALHEPRVTSIDSESRNLHGDGTRVVYGGWRVVHKTLNARVHRWLTRRAHTERHAKLSRTVDAAAEFRVIRYSRVWRNPFGSSVVTSGQAVSVCIRTIRACTLYR